MISDTDKSKKEKAWQYNERATEGKKISCLSWMAGHKQNENDMDQSYSCFLEYVRYKIPVLYK